LHYASLENEQHQAELTGLAQTASRMAVLLYDIESGQDVQLASVRNERLTRRAIDFLRAAEKASERLDNYQNNLANLLGSEVPDVSYYRYYIGAKKLMGRSVEESDKELKGYVETLKCLTKDASSRGTKRTARPPKQDVKRLADFFLGLGRMMLGQAFPPPLEPES
jgi:hypothetical protein